MTSKSVLMKASLIAISVATLMAAAPPSSRADDGEKEQMIEIAPITVGAGNQVSVGQCPCFRWTIGVKAVSGKIETQDILISTDALFKYQQTGSADFQQLGSRLFTAGAAEMLIKGGHVGLGFKGVSFGQDKDRGFKEILRAGLYVMANIVAKDAVRFDIRSGYDFDKVATTTSKEASRHFLTQEAVLAWKDQAFSGNVKASIAFNPESFFDTKSIRAGASTSVRARIVSFDDLELGASAQVSAEYDPFLEVLGLKPFNATGTLMMDLSWVAVRDHSN